jgi:nickel/cobalt transporter (NicO) family protein
MTPIAAAGSLAQAGGAILVVYGSLSLLQGTARGTIDAGEGWMTQVDHAAVALIGGWILVCGIQGLRRSAGPQQAASHGHDAGCGCGHAHHPDPDAVARASSARETIVLALGMAARPCTGALVILVIAWKMNLAAAGAAGVFGMGLGTAVFTALVAVLVVRGRDTALLAAGNGPAARFALPALRILAGGVILMGSAVLVLLPFRMP